MKRARDARDAASMSALVEEMRAINDDEAEVLARAKYIK
jgi:hypothetical protein